MTLLSTIVWTTVAFQSVNDAATLVQLNTAKSAKWSCSSPQAHGVVYPENHSTVAWPCDGSELLQCDGDGYEPLDVSRNGCPRAVSVTPEIARRVRVRFPVGIGTALFEWRALGNGSTELIAARRFNNVGDSIDVPLASSPRFLRVFRDGAAPVSLFVPGAKQVAVATVPSTEAGGELLFLSQPAIAQPVELTGLGYRGVSLPLNQTSHARAAVFPANYEFHLNYASGIRSEGVAAAVTAGRTLELSTQQFEPVGVASVVPAPEMIDQQGDVRILRNHEQHGSVVQTQLWSSQSTGQERWLVDGLPAGQYEAHLELVDGTLARTTFKIVENTVSQVRLSGGKTRVFGHVIIGGRAAPAGTRLQFAVPRQLKPFETTVDGNGNFNISLGDPGRYTARLMTTKYLASWTDSVNFQPGLNRFDWKIPGGMLQITLKRQDGGRIDEIVQLQIEGGRFRAAAPILAEEANAPITAFGIPLSDKLTVKADTSSSLVAEAVTVELSSVRSEAKVDLLLRNVSAALEVRGARSGDLLPTATAVAGNLNLDQDPPASGQFEIRRTAPGTAIIVKAPAHVPVCHIFKPTDIPAFRVTLPDANLLPVEIRLNVKATRAVGFFLGLPGSDCPIPLAELNPQMRYEGANAVFSLRLPPGTYQYAPYGRYPLQTFSVPGKGLDLKIPPPK